MHRLISLLGLLVMIGLAWLLSAHRRRVSLRIVIGGVLLQFLIAAATLLTEPGERFFMAVGEVFDRLLGFVDAGASFVFGPRYEDFYFAFKVLPTIIFFSTLMSVLYYLGVMQWVVKIVAIVMQRTLGTSGAESLSTAANIFVGQTEAPLMVRPYVATMTQSELMAVMVGGFATIAGGVMAAYVGMGVSAGHLLTASLIAAPATLVVAKILQPEVDEPLTRGSVKLPVQPTGVNLIDAAANGAAEGVKLAINVAAMLIAFLALIAMFDFLLGWVGSWFGFAGENALSLSGLMGQMFAPLAWTMGIPWNDCPEVGQLLGLRVVANEFVAYEQLSQWLAPDSAIKISERSAAIATYALCGFANFASIGVQLGGIGPMAPQRCGDLARLGLRAMIGGNLACFMTACVAGMFLPG
jgi:concentrative nucleoside transporter, CNT family